MSVNLTKYDTSTDIGLWHHVAANDPAPEWALYTRRCTNAVTQPLVGHREGLRANEMMTLHSAFRILARLGETAH
jgi:hypothetical protein